MGEKAKEEPMRVDQIILTMFKPRERLGIIKFLTKTEENLTVEEIAERLKLKASVVRENLAALEKVGLVRGTQIKPPVALFFKWTFLSWDLLEKGKIPTNFLKEDFETHMRRIQDIYRLVANNSESYEKLKNALERWFEEQKVTLEIGKLNYLVWAVKRVPEEWIKPLENYFVKELQL